MARNWTWKAMGIAACTVASMAMAQGHGTTTGPEGSEVGKGGYTSASGPGSFSLELEGGGAFLTSSGAPSLSPPLFGGLTATFWGTDYYRIDLSGFYVPDVRWVDALIGPSFRFLFYPIGFNLGLQAGALIPTRSGPGEDVHFILSPRVGIDFLTESHLQLGLYANWDLAIGTAADNLIRVYLSFGYRF